MEAIGLVITVAGLAGLLTSCLECLDLVEASRSFAREDSILCTNFEVQKLRLLMWGESTGLSTTANGSQKSSSLLRSKRTRAVVHQILLEVQLLFDDTETLKTRYGLLPAKDELSGDPSPFSESGLTQGFKERLIKFQSC